jgi:hypothetical protein
MTHVSSIDAYISLNDWDWSLPAWAAIP